MSTDPQTQVWLSQMGTWLKALALFTFALFGMVTFGVSLVLRRRHRREVSRLMSESAGRGLPPHIEYDYGAARPRLSPGAARLRRSIRRRRLWVAGTYAAAGAVHVAITLCVFIYQIERAWTPSETPPALDARTVLSLLGIFSWPIIWTAHQVLSARGLSLLFWISAVVALMLWVEGDYGWDAVLVFVVVQAPPLLIQLMVANRTLKAVGVPVLIPVSVFTAGVALAVAAMVLPGRAPLWLRIALGLCALAVFTYASWRTAKRLARRYERKQTNEQSMLLDAYWLLLTEYLLVFMTAAGAELGAGGVLVGVLGMAAAFGGYVLVTRVGLRLGRDPGRPNVRLLLLRVFGSHSRGARLGERLLDDLSRHWRYVGSIQLIAGTDLAAYTLEPHEIMGLVSGRLGDFFISDEEDVERRVGAPDTAPDQDGRFRVNEFFCHADVWPSAFRKLLDNTEVVLMDLRGLTRENRGVLQEFGQLLDTFHVNRLVLLADASTDRTHLETTARELWGRMAAGSPNLEGGQPSLTVAYVERHGPREIKRLLYRLCEAAQHAPGAPFAK